MNKFEEKYLYTYPPQPKLWKSFIDDSFFIWPHGIDSLLEFIEHLNTVHPTIRFTRDICHTEIAFMDLTIYIKAYTLHYILKPLIDTSIWITFQNTLWALRGPYHIHSSSGSKEYTLNPNIYWRHKYICTYFSPAGSTPWCCTKSWLKTNRVTREQFLTPVQNDKDKNIPFMLITTYSRANPNFKELFSKHWPYLGRSTSLENWENSTSCLLTGSHLLLKIC